MAAEAAFSTTVALYLISIIKSVRFVALIQAGMQLTGLYYYLYS
jgi:hypothetical protein